MSLLRLAKPKRGITKPTGYRRPNTGKAKLPLRPTGKEILRLGQKPELQTGGPGLPPEGFVGVWTSLTEWYVYWALCRLTDKSKDPRKPPFVGNQYFVYQKQENGGRVPGGSVTDFAVSTPTGWIGLRVETERWHIWTTADIQMKDAYIKTHLLSMERVISLWDQHFIGDPSGQQVIHVVSLALKGIEMPSPIKWGNAQRVRP